MQKTNNLQEIFLTQVRRERRPVTMFLMNGFGMANRMAQVPACISMSVKECEELVLEA